MQVLLTARSERAYAALGPEEQRQVQKALRNMSEDLRYPGLGVKRIRGTRGIWEARASRGLRITLETQGDSIILRNVGRHDDALARP
jgi:mRNA-degrading endonuclease RelE of RelBE toxin-antitoxin system